MCDKAWGRPGFVKVLIDVWAVGDLKRELDVIIPSINGSEEAKVRIGVEFLDIKLLLVLNMWFLSQLWVRILKLIMRGL